MVGSLNGPKHLGLDGYYDENRHWRPNTPLLPDEERVFPDTVPNEVLATHRLGCECRPCARYPSRRVLRELKLRYAARLRQ